MIRVDRTPAPTLPVKEETAQSRAGTGGVSRLTGQTLQGPHAGKGSGLHT